MSFVKAKVVVGMPVYNGAATLLPVIESLLSQTYKDFLLFISDNCSTDNTAEICKKFSMTDKRVVYVRQDRNIGPEANFDYVLTHSAGEYFMWAAADDVRSPEFLSINLNFLEYNPDYMGSTSPVRFEDGSFDPAFMGDEARHEDEFYERIKNFFGVWHANGRFYSLFRRAAVQHWRNVTTSYLASDWSLIISVLLAGKLNRVEQGFVVLGRGGLSNSAGFFGRYRKGPVSWVLPLYRFSGHTLRCLRGAPLCVRANVLRSLIRLNLSAAKSQLLHQVKVGSR